jgi:hypothetical protein
MLYLLEGFSAILSVVANVYCTGNSQLPVLSSFDYSYLELIGSGFLLIFSLFLLLTFGIIFYCKFCFFLFFIIIKAKTMSQEND